ncbi:MFS transporter [Pelagibius sp.]|uniref:MFS transporter n=1 Tax=Pelagibius sp. TaxID=1931238 RepID=UPI003B5003C4
MKSKQIIHGSGWRVLLICLMILATKCGRSMYFVIVSWLALHITGDVASVGLVLVWWPLLSLTLGPLMGAVIDRFNRCNLFILGEGLRLGAIVGLLLASSFGPPSEADEGISMVALHLTACMVSLGSLFSLPATQGLLQAVGRESLTRIVALGASVHQFGSISGAALGGLTVALLGFEAALSIVATCCLAAMAFAAPLHRDGDLLSSDEAPSYSTAVMDGVRLVFRDQQLLIACLAIALLWSAAQMSTVLLAAFTRFELGLGADAYGWIDAMWGVGAIIAGFLMVRLSHHLPERYLRRFGLLFLAGATACFSAAGELWSALVLHGLMGMAFAANRIVYDTYILKTVESGMVGRVRNNIQAAIGTMGILVYLLPSLYEGHSVRLAYMVFAGFLAVSAVALVLWRYRLNKAKTPDAQFSHVDSGGGTSTQVRPKRANDMAH